MSEAALTTIIKRLEAATVKLEEMAAKVPTSAPASSSAASSAPSSAAVSAFDDFLNTFTKPYVDLSAKIGGLVKEQVCSISVTRVNQPAAS